MMNYGDEILKLQRKLEALSNDLDSVTTSFNRVIASLTERIDALEKAKVADDLK